MDKLNRWSVSVALAITMSLAYMACAVAVDLFPEPSINFFNAWFHGLDISVLRAHKPNTIGVFIYGLIGVAAIAFLVGWVYATVYNLVAAGLSLPEVPPSRLPR